GHGLEGSRGGRDGDTGGALYALVRAASAWPDVAVPRWSTRAQGLAVVVGRKARRADAPARWTRVSEFAKRQGLSHHLRRWGVAEPNLSTREVEVLRLVARGEASGGIADARAVSRGTVAHHRSPAGRELLGPP